jgi:hypothetical protein
LPSSSTETGAVVVEVAGEVAGAVVAGPADGGAAQPVASRAARTIAPTVSGVRGGEATVTVASHHPDRCVGARTARTAAA